MKVKQLKIMALLGLVGGLCVGLGDLLVYSLPNVHNLDGVYADWAAMGMWRLTLSLYLGCLGSVFLMAGFISLYTIIQRQGKTVNRGIGLVVGSGVVLTGIGHFLIACIAPMTYKGALMAGASPELAQGIAGFWESEIGPLKGYIMAVVILLQSVWVMVLILRGGLDCPKWMAVLTPLGLTLLSIPVSILLTGTGLEGLAESFESLGEGLMCLAVYCHWNRWGKKMAAQGRSSDFFQKGLESYHRR